MDHYTDTELGTQNWTPLGIAVRGVVTKLAAGERIGKSPPAASPLHHAAEWLEPVGDESHRIHQKKANEYEPQPFENSSKCRFLDPIDFGFVFILVWHRRQPFVWIIGIQISARA